jgi:hypothetical protein
MKVATTGTRSLGSIRRSKRSTGAAEGGFASERAGGAEPAAPGAASAVNVLYGVLSVQEVGEKGQGRRDARARGEDVLQRLEQIRLGLLAGRIPERQLSQLVRVLREQRAQFNDPRLGEILDEIELRAAVELAKLGRYD